MLEFLINLFCPMPTTEVVAKSEDKTVCPHTIIMWEDNK